MALAPSGELATLGLGRETTYGVAAAPTIFLVPSDISFFGDNAALERPGARRRLTRTYPATGMFTGKGSFQAEADPDSIGAVLAMAFGSETVAANTTANNPPSNTVSTTITAPASVGPGTVAVTCGAGTFFTGNYYIVDTGAVQETVQALPGSSTGLLVAAFRFTHASGAAVTNSTILTAYDHTFLAASPRPFFTAQINRIVDGLNCLGNKVSTLDLAANAKSILEAKVTTEYAFESTPGTIVAPTYSTLYPFVFESPQNRGKINGLQSTATVLEWSLSLNTGLITDFSGFGSGRARSQLPETMTKYSGTAKIAFETRDAYLAFWGSPVSTGPQQIVSQCAFEFDYVSSDSVNSNVPYSLKLLGNAGFIISNHVAIKPASYLEQDISFELAETFNGAGDDLKAILTNANSGTSF